jgi:hypothetical protein
MKLAMKKVTIAEEQPKMIHTIWVINLPGHRRATDDLEDNRDEIGENTPQAILSHNDLPLHTSQKKPQKGWYANHSSCKYYCLDGDSTYSKVEIDFPDGKHW